jgi:RHS repeat-associated protein
VAATTGAGAVRFFHHDGGRNTVVTTDAAGQVVGQFGYFPFGTPAFATGGGATHFRFLGNELDDETGLLYCRSRYYSPRLGRFVSPDLLIVLNPEQALLTPIGLNPYVYAADGPVRLLDETGAWWEWVVGGLIIAALIVATVVVGIATGGAGFAFGILLAASIGSAVGAGVGTYAAARAGGDLGAGFLFGALIGGAAGAGGYALGALATGAIGGVWGSVLGGALEGGIVGAGNGAIVGWGGGAGSASDILANMALGFLLGAVLGGIAGYVKFNIVEIRASTVERFGQTSAPVYDPASGQPILGPTGQPITQTVPMPGQAQGFWQGVGQVAGSVIEATARPAVYAGLGSVVQAGVYYQWDDLRSWLVDTFGGDDRQVDVPIYSHDL